MPQSDSGNLGVSVPEAARARGGGGGALWDRLGCTWNVPRFEVLSADLHVPNRRINV